MNKIIATVTNDLSYDQRMQRICATLAAEGYEVLLVGRRLRESQILDNQAFEQRRLRCFFRRGVLFYAEWNLRLFLFLIFKKYDAVCTVDLDTMPGGCLAALLRGKKRVFDAHEFFTETPEVCDRFFVKKFWEAVAWVFVRFYHQAYTVGPALAEIFEKKYGLPFAVVRNVPLSSASDASKIQNPKSKIQNPMPLLASSPTTSGRVVGEDANNGTNSNFQFPISNSKFLLYQGALNEGRGLEQAIEAMTLLADTGLELWLAGEGDLSDRLRKLAEKSPVRERIRFLGHQKPDDLRHLTQQAWLGLNLLENRGLSYYFSLANKFFDYVQAGVPGLTMAFPEYRRLCSEHRVAVLLDELSPQAVAAAVRRLFENENEYRALQTACREAAEKWVWEREKERLLEVWRAVETL